MVDQVDVPGAIQRHEYFFDALGDALKEAAHRGRTSDSRLLRTPS